MFLLYKILFGLLLLCFMQVVIVTRVLSILDFWIEFHILCDDMHSVVIYTVL